MYAFATLGPALGYIIGGQLLDVYVDFDLVLFYSYTQVWCMPLLNWEPALGYIIGGQLLDVYVDFNLVLFYSYNQV